MDEKELKEIQKEFARVRPEVDSPPAKIIEVLKSKKSFLVTSHIRPDGDALGSQLALASLLEEMGKSVIILDPDPIPDSFRFLPGSDRIIPVCRVGTGRNDFTFPDCPEVALVLDAGSLDRIGKVAEVVGRAKLIINIDHHLSNNKFGNINLVEEKASAVGELIFSIICSLGFPVGKERAVALYTAILTDTGSFQYANTTERTHRIVSCLLREGVNPAGIAEKIYSDTPFPRQKLLGLALTTLRKSHRGRISWFLLTREMYEKAEAEDSEADGFINYVQSIRGTELALLFRETDKKNSIRVSLRSRGNIDVDSLARKFGGGGHQRAAGCLIEGNIEAVEKQVLKAAGEIIE